MLKVRCEGVTMKHLLTDTRTPPIIYWIGLSEKKLDKSFQTQDILKTLKKMHFSFCSRFEQLWNIFVMLRTF